MPTDSKTVELYDVLAEEIHQMEIANNDVIAYMEAKNRLDEIGKIIKEQAVEDNRAIRTSAFSFGVFTRKTTDWKGLFKFLVDRKRVEASEIDAFTEEKQYSRVTPLKDETTNVEL